MAQVKNMVFMTEKYVFINSKTPVDEEIGKKIKSLPKIFVTNLQKFCPYITEYGYDEHTHEAILVCRFDNKNEFAETTKMDFIAKVMNDIHKQIGELICNNPAKEITEFTKIIKDFISVTNENKEDSDAN